MTSTHPEGLAWTLLAVFLLAASPLAAQDDAGESDRDELFDRSMNELFETAERISDQPGADQPTAFAGDDRPRWLQGLTVTKSDNPMLEQACREQALAGNTQRLLDAGAYDSDEETLTATMDHMHEHHAFISENQVSYADYLQSLTDCKEFCAPLVSSLMQCHILSVARRPHGIVLFDIDSSRVEEDFRASVISEMAQQYRDRENAQILLIGRASQIGDLSYNRRLAAQRALAVRDELTAAGVSFEKIRPIWFGWEPPQIDSVMADEYGLQGLLDDYGFDGMNQSVVMVIF